MKRPSLVSVFWLCCSLPGLAGGFQLPKMDDPSSLSSSSDRPRRLVIVGGGIGGLSSALDARHLLRPQDQVTVVSDRPEFSFTPSNPWVGTRMRKPQDIQLPLAEILPRYKIEFRQGKAVNLQPTANKLLLEGGTTIEYDFLIIATGPRLAFEEIPGLKNFGNSICITPHALHAADALDQLVKEPGPVIVGATQGASCFGPAYEYAFLVHHELYKRGGRQLVQACPITFVSAEPYAGHLGLKGAGDSQHILSKLFEKKHIDSMYNARVVRVHKESVQVERLDPQEKGYKVVERKELPSKLTMLIPPFRGHAIWKNIHHLTNDAGMVITNEFQQSPTYPNIFAVGVAAHIPNVDEDTVLSIGAPKTGYLIESQGTAAVKNIRSLIDDPDRPLHTTATLNGLCLTDFGNDGAIFLTVPQIPPRRVDVTITGKVATLAKIAFEKYFLHKIESGDTDPYYEKYMLKLVGVERTKDTA